MDESEVEQFLGRGGTGVISFAAAADEPPYSLPVSYGFNREEQHFHFRLAVGPSSQKGAFVDRPMSFITYRETDDGWQSVNATGTLSDITDLPDRSPPVQDLWRVSIPFVDIFPDTPENVSFRRFVMDPDQISGRKQVTEEE